MMHAEMSGLSAEGGEAGWASLVGHVGKAEELLRRRSTEGRREAQERLRAAEDLLGDLVARRALATATARRVLQLRDELSVHLSAATTLDALELHARATTVLRRAVGLAQAGLGEILDN